MGVIAAFCLSASDVPGPSVHWFSPQTSRRESDVQNLQPVIWQSVPYQRRAIHAGQCGMEVEEEQSRQVTGSFTSKSSRLEAFVER